jgi:excisionase family DNA binding protein
MTSDPTTGDGGRRIEPALLTVSEAATYLGMSRRTVERIAAAGVLPVVQLADHRRRFRRSDLDEYINDSIQPVETA